MRTTIDHAGRSVNSKEIRNLARLTPGSVLDVRWRDGRIEIEPAPAQVRLRRRGKRLVATPQEKTETLTTDAVERTRSALIDERTGGVGSRCGIDAPAIAAPAFSRGRLGAD